MVKNQYLHIELVSTAFLNRSENGVNLIIFFLQTRNHVATERGQEALLNIHSKKSSKFNKFIAVNLYLGD